MFEISWDKRYLKSFNWILNRICKKNIWQIYESYLFTYSKFILCKNKYIASYLFINLCISTCRNNIYGRNNLVFTNEVQLLHLRENINIGYISGTGMYMVHVQYASKLYHFFPYIFHTGCAHRVHVYGTRTPNTFFGFLLRKSKTYNKGTTKM
jgi:hypothetical protein